MAVLIGHKSLATRENSEAPAHLRGCTHSRVCISRALATPNGTLSTMTKRPHSTQQRERQPRRAKNWQPIADVARGLLEPAGCQNRCRRADRRPADPPRPEGSCAPPAYLGERQARTPSGDSSARRGAEDRAGRALLRLLGLHTEERPRWLKGSPHFGRPLQSRTWSVFSAAGNPYAAGLLPRRCTNSKEHGAPRELGGLSTRGAAPARSRGR